MNQRITSLRERAVRSRHVGSAEIGALREESFVATEGEPAAIREAKAFVHVWENCTLVIRENELIVGAWPVLEYDEEKETVPEIFGRVPFKCFWPIAQELEHTFHEGLFSGAGNHTTIDYETVFELGFEGLIQRIDERLSLLSPDEADVETKRDFFKGLKIVARGYIRFCERYSDHAAVLAQETIDPVRRGELETISAVCRRVVARPPRNFREACQAAWFCFFFLPDAPGRVDQFLFPSYEADARRGAITPDEARELLSCLWIKYFGHAGARQGVSALHHLTLGGVTPEGHDASNELTWLCLDVTEDLQLHRPQVGLRWNRNTPRDLLKRAIRVLRTHSGNPDFCNDEQIVPALVKTGIAPEDARRFSLSGCHEVIVTGRAQMGSVEGFINLPKMLRMALGLEPELAAGADPASINSFEDLWSALEAVMETTAAWAHEISVARDQEAADQPGGNICASLVVNDCIERAKGYTQGGARYNHCNWDIIGLANLADSLAAIRTLVHEEKELSLADYVAVVRDNWEGKETLRLRIQNRMPHFGNDDDEVDLLAARVIETFSEIMKRRTPFRGGEYILGTLAGGENMHVEFGRVTKATPDGRVAGKTYADSIGAAHGRDTKGVTALLNSVAKLPHSLLPTAVSLNVKLDPRLLETDEGIEKIAALVEGHFHAGGQQFQFNIVSREMLEEARRNPDEHRDLMVRVAGYSAPFTSLWEDLQDEIIERTGHEVR